jgi:caffeoyl-CoA O-methyltransferase
MNLLEQYAQAHSQTFSGETLAVLKELERATHLHTLAPQMLSAGLQGEWLGFFAKMIAPAYIVEIGTFTGYSAICLAQGLQAGGTLHTIELNEELEPLIKKFVAKADLAEKIRLYIGDAKQIIPTLPNGIDLAFIDADKMAYTDYYEQLLPKIKTGGYLLIDNVIWYGKVLEQNPDAKTKSIQAFNQYVAQDTRVEKFLLTIRDGLYIVRKK